MNTTNLQQIDVLSFGRDTTQSFKYINDGVTGECFISQEFVTCIGTSDSSVPEIEITPFPKQKPGAIMLGYGGAAYTMVEGVPPAGRELKTGEWVDFGRTQCGKPDDDTLICQSDSAAFAIEGSNRMIRTSGKVLDSAEDLMDEDSGPVGSYSQSDDTLVQGPIMCGAMEILDRYDEVSMTEGGGNVLYVELDDWVCSSPTYARSQELRARTVCENPARGLEVRDPVM